MPHIHSIYRYPIKGLTPEPLPRVALTPGKTLPGDRLYAIENGASGFDRASPKYLPKTHFLMLMKNERLATLRAAFDQDSHDLTVTYPSPLWGGEGVGVARRGANVNALTSPHDPPPHPPPTSMHSGARGRGPGGGRESITANLRTAEGRAAIETFFAKYCADDLRGPPKILHADGHSFSDVAKKVVSIINLASVGAIETMLGAPVHPLRFRGNVYVEGWPAWSELDLVGKELIINPPPFTGEDARAKHRGGGKSDHHDGVRLQVVKRIVRCAATNVDPDTGHRDLEIPHTLLRHLDHADCGIYAEVVGGGEISEGDAIEIS